MNTCRETHTKQLTVSWDSKLSLVGRNVYPARWPRMKRNHNEKNGACSTNFLPRSPGKIMLTNRNWHTGRVGFQSTEREVLSGHIQLIARKMFTCTMHVMLPTTAPHQATQTLQRVLNRELLPTFGKPTIPIFTLLPNST